MLDHETRHDTGVAPLWLPTLQELARRSAHEIKNALNGVAVNLEVVRSRLDRAVGQGDTVAVATAPFARTASEQLEELAALADALLTMTRVIGGQTDVVVLTRRAVRLAASIARAEGRAVVLDAAAVEAPLTAASADVVRWIVVRLLLDGLGEDRSLTVTVREGLAVRVSAAPQSLPELDVELCAAAASFDVVLTHDNGGWLVRFPPIADLTNSRAFNDAPENPHR